MVRYNIQRAGFKHAIFWIGSFLILYRLFTQDYSNGKADTLYTLMFHLPLTLLVYLNIYLINRYLIFKKHLYYLSGIIVTVICALIFHFLIFDKISDLIFPGFYFIAYYSIWQILQFILVYWIISSLLILTQYWFTLKNKQIRLEQENHDVKLNALKGQLNPHFLFNSLNNIYSMLHPDQSEGKNFILKLSDSLRYMLYETEDKYVLLEKEVDYLINYFDLEKLRLKDSSKIDFLVTGDMQGYLIAPLILLPMIENCFKHRDYDKPEINISLKMMDQNRLVLNTKNTINREMIGDGIGLKNLRSRLDLIYSGKYQFDFHEHDGFYHATLSLNLDL